MMKVKTLKKFRDRYTGRIYRPGEVFECTAERLAEIQAVGELVEEISDDAKSTPGDAVNSDRARFEKMTVVQLRQYADKNYKLTFAESMKKAEMIDVLMEREKG